MGCPTLRTTNDMPIVWPGSFRARLLTAGHLRGDAAKYGGKDAAEFGFGAAGQPVGAPRHVQVGADQHAAVLADLTGACPVLVNVDVLAARSDDVCRDLHAQLRPGAHGGVGPRLPGNAGQQAEAALARQVVGAHLAARVAQPDVRQPGPRPGGRVVIQLGIAGVRGLAGAVRHDRSRTVPLAELHAVRVELVVLELQGLTQCLALLEAVAGVAGAGGDPGHHHFRVAGVAQAQRVEDRPELLDALVSAQHDLLAYRRALGIVGIEQLLPCRAAQHVRELPGKVVRVLDGSVGTQPVRRRVPVHGIPDAEDTAGPVPGGVHLVVAPQGRGPDRHRDRVVADKLVDDPLGHLVIDFGRRLADVVAPDDEPLVPRPDPADEAQADPADVGSWLQHPVQDAGPVLDVLREVSVEDDVHAAGDVHLALERQRDVGRDRAAPAVGADDVLGADAELGAGHPVADPHRNAVSVLGQPGVLS